MALYGATVGRIGILGIEAATNQAVCYIIPDERRANRQYLYYALRSKVPVWLSQRVGGGQPNISQGIIKDTKIPLPPLSEQKRIADILDKADAIRRKRQETIDAGEAFLTSQFLEMFGHPSTNSKRWPVMPFGDVVENHDSRRVPLKQSDRDKREGPYPYYGSVGIIDHIDDYLFDGEYLLISEDGKHLESRNRPIACLASGQFWVNNHAHVVAYNGTVDLVYLAKFMEMSPIRSFVTGIDQFKLNRSSLDRIPVAVPPTQLQHRFLEQRNHVHVMLSRQAVACSESDDLFNSLVQRAFKGEL